MIMTYAALPPHNTPVALTISGRLPRQPRQLASHGARPGQANPVMAIDLFDLPDVGGGDGENGGIGVLGALRGRGG